MAIAKQKRLRDSRITATLLIGIVVITLLILFALLGPLFTNPKMARVGAVGPNLPPSAANLFGTDSQGRDVFTTIIMAIPPTLKVGLVAGLISVVLGLILGLVAGFFPGWPDSIISTFSDVLMAVPALAFMILVVARMSRPNIVLVSAVVGFMTWPGTARGIRSLVLSIRERAFTLVARANGETELGVLFREVMPNLLPLMLASFIGAVTMGIFTVMALEVLGLGNNVIPTLGMMIFWSQRFSAVLRGMWWWWSPPIVVVAMIFIGLYLISRGLDRYVSAAMPITRSRRRPRLTSPRSEPATPAGKVSGAMDDATAVFQVKNLQVIYETSAGIVKAVDDVSFSLQAGERMGLIGESGCGKTTMATALMRLSTPPAFITGGRVLLGGRDLLSISEEDLRNLRLKEIALIPQGSMNSLNPVMRIGQQVKDGLRAHASKLSNQELDEKTAEALQRVGLRPEVADRFPHQLSGGMKQRVVMAIANALAPKVIIADEPTSALDVVIQKQVMLTLSRLQQEEGASVLLIGHDMGLITQFADKLGVLYAGKLVEVGSVQEILDSPLHPYTRLLIDSLPTLDGKHDMVSIAGLPPELLHLPSGCAFHPRCPFADEGCKREAPVLQEPIDHRQVSCHLYPEHTALPPVPVKANILEA
jgi:oligopeptide/dipeptide ABC transporter ATP-binding protein